MRKRRWIWLALPVALPLALWGLFVMLDRTPHHQGRSAEAWLEDFIHGSPETIDQAEAAFQAMGEEALPFLSQTLQRRDSALRRAYWKFTRQWKPLSNQAFPDWQWRTAAAQAIAVLGPRALPLAPALTHAATDRDVQINPAWTAQAVLALGLDGVPPVAATWQAQDSLIAPFSHALLQGWIDLFDRHGLPPSLRPVIKPLLLRILNESDHKTHLALTCRLTGWFVATQTNHADLVHAIIGHLNHDDPWARRVCMNSLAQFTAHAGSIVPALASQMSVKDSQTRAAAIRALGNFAPSELEPVIPKAGQLTADPADSVSMAALQLLGHVGAAAQSQTDRIIRVFQDNAESKRTLAARVLPQVDPDPALAVPNLIKLLEDNSWEVRAQAALSLGHFGAQAATAVPALIGQLRYPREAAQISAVQALGEIGPPAAAAIPELHMAWNNNQSALGPHVQKALASIQSDSPLD